MKIRNIKVFSSNYTFRGYVEINNDIYDLEGEFTITGATSEEPEAIIDYVEYFDGDNSFALTEKDIDYSELAELIVAKGDPNVWEQDARSKEFDNDGFVW